MVAKTLLRRANVITAQFVVRSEKEMVSIAPRRLFARIEGSVVLPRRRIAVSMNLTAPFQPVGWHLYFRRHGVPWDVRGGNPGGATTAIISVRF